MDQQIKEVIAKQEEMLKTVVGEQEKYAIRYCLRVLNDLVHPIDTGIVLPDDGF